MSRQIPRYVVPGTGQTYEIPIVVRGLSAPTAIVAIDAPGFVLALKVAQEWATKYGEKKDFPHYPTVEYRGRRFELRKLNDSAAYIENKSQAKWVPIQVIGA